MNKFIVITTINKKTKAIKEFSKLLKDWKIILVGDKKSQTIKNKDNIIFLSIEEQKKLGFKITQYLPYNHYARKNIGYLYAMKAGADIIYDTDDDNIPYKNWNFPEFKANNYVSCNKKFVNIYKYFTSEKIWPRGYPLEEVNAQQKISIKRIKKLKIGAWQGLSDIEPDVDAIYRLLINKKIYFKNKALAVLGKGLYCPFNSQNTLWNSEVFPYLYLPSTVSFRFTDILRGYVAQRLFWKNNYHLGFTRATVYQIRNKHNLMKDFKDEIECYLNTKDIVAFLDVHKLTGDKLENILDIYKALKKKKCIKESELNILNAWISDIEKLNF